MPREIDPITLQVGLGPRGLRLHLPKGRTLDISATDAGVRMIVEMLHSAEQAAKYDQRLSGHIGNFPTQEITDTWERQMRQKAELDRQIKKVTARKKEEAKAAYEKKWGDLANIEVNI